MATLHNQDLERLLYALIGAFIKRLFVRLAGCSTSHNKRFGYQVWLK